VFWRIEHIETSGEDGQCTCLQGCFVGGGVNPACEPGCDCKTMSAKVARKVSGQLATRKRCVARSDNCDHSARCRDLATFHRQQWRRAINVFQAWRIVGFSQRDKSRTKPLVRLEFCHSIFNRTQAVAFLAAPLGEFGQHLQSPFGRTGVVQKIAEKSWADVFRSY